MSPAWGVKLGSNGRPGLGIGTRVTPESVPTPREVHYSGFRNGLLVADRAGDVPEGYFSKALDVESTRSDGVVRATPIKMIEETAHLLDNLFGHPTLDFQSELIAVDPPWFGIRQGETFSWYNIGTSLDSTPDRHWVYSNYGDILIFSNGRKSYYRDSTNTALFLADSTMPAAETIFTAFGRLFMGGTLSPQGEYNVLGLLWNGTGVDGHKDWTGPDAGGELLLSDSPQSDRIIAGRIMSYDTVAILCRRSLWIGTKTGVSFRPLDPEFRLSGIGCVFEGSARTTEGGVTFLSDEGVRHFDGQRAEIISGPINKELLPLSFDEIRSYKAAWDGGRRRYILCAPCCTYVYQFPTPEYPQGAWFKKSVALTNVIPFARQVEDPTWDDFGVQTWDDLGTQIWLDFGTPETNAAPEILYASGRIYGREDPTGKGYFGMVMAAVFEPRPAEAQAADDRTHDLMEVKGYRLEYRGFGNVQIHSRDESGAYRFITSASLPPANRSRTTNIDVSHSIRVTGIALRILSSELEILSVKQIVQDSGQALGDMVTEDDELLDETAPEVLSSSDTLTLWW